MKAELESHPVRNLKAILKDLKQPIGGYSKLKKPDLVKRIMELKAKGFPVPKIEMYVAPAKKGKAAAKKVPFTLKSNKSKAVDVSVSDLTKALKAGKSPQQIINDLNK